MTILPSHKDEIYKKLDELFGARLDEFDISLITTNPDLIPSRLLPHLAASFDIETNGANEQSIRNLIKNAFIIKKGTVESIRVALKSFFAGASIEEWHQYGGEPYFFRVKVLLDGVSFDSWDKLEAIVSTYKNVRSVLDRISIELECKKAVCQMGGYSISGESLEIYPYQTPSIEPSGTHFIGAKASLHEWININLDIRNLDE
ncbi:phage tail protein I [Campylobacter hyointestinalis]|uniref:phage tail protein I n=1 Tax=Campylobacter hyointestinalis TaxID=198 RepID=UPI000DCF1F21|nr:phage tail protein I [Campylobacter hyointestinalis]RAZ54563.1 phage tail protein I [Campylobacter hyointestinalis subsp. lawsonii]RAZ59956.1 phage tail protein I [Campylobacter hyointestinalis subsp. lawsonii]RAZ62907.1 phage tail protein I [Campylobacter hyointestinalis subsp. lawsonii]